MCPIELCEQAWARLYGDLDAAKLAEITQEIALDQVMNSASKLLAAQVRGRTVVKIA
jgi:acrylyl-CoA reductase (NADPH)